MNKFLPKSIRNPQGFTLVELMVVVSIIAILSVIGIVLFTGAQKNARDVKRRADIQAISTAMEKNYNATSANPYTAAAITDFSDNKVPVDPQTGSVYTVTGTLPGKIYVVCATLENLTAGNSTSGVSIVSGSGSFFCRQNQQ